MSATATARKPTPARILRDLESLPFEKLDKLVPKIIELRLRKHPHVMSPREEWLQKRIEAGLPHQLRRAYARQIEKRRRAGLTDAEQRRLEAIVEQMETFNVTWLEWALELAKLRGLSLDRLLKGMNISRPADVCV